jgi:hypothetical protein
LYQISDVKLLDFQKCTNEDSELLSLLNISKAGWPAKQKDVRFYWTCREKINYTDGLLFKGNFTVRPLMTLNTTVTSWLQAGTS